MVYEVMYLKLKKGKLSEVETSKLLMKCVYLSMQEFESLKQDIKQNTISKSKKICPFVKEMSYHFGLTDVLDCVHSLENILANGDDGMPKYRQLVRQWTIAICLLRSYRRQQTYCLPMAS